MKILETYDVFELCEIIDEFNLCHHGSYNHLIYDFGEDCYPDEDDYFYIDIFHNFTITNAKSELTYTEFNICKNAQEIFKSSIFNDFQDFEQQFREMWLEEYQREKKQFDLKLLNALRKEKLAKINDNIELPDRNWYLR